MKTVCDFRQIIVMNGKKFDTSIKRHLQYHEPYEKEMEINSFDELWELAKEEYIFNAECTYSLFGAKRIVKFFNAENFGYMNTHYYEYVKEKDFKPFKIELIMKKDTRKNSIKTLMELLSAKDFAEWCKDHGISVVCN